MDPRISSVLGIIDCAKILEGRFQINQRQCKRLVDFYTRAGQFFDELKGHFSESADASQRLYSLPSLDVTISILQKGQLLVEKYTDQENWFDNMMTAGVNQDSFVAIHLELGDCIRLIHDAVVTQGLASSMQVFMPLLSLDEDDRATLFNRDAEQDKKYMLDLIEVSKTKISTINARNESRNGAMEQKSAEALDMASEKISKAINGQQPGTKTQDQLPGYLRIDPKEITLIEMIGSGGSAEVHRGRWLQCECAVKIFSAGNVDGLRKEVENLIPLRHPNIVLMMGFSVGKYSANRPMVVMELLDSDLYTLISKGDAEVLVPSAVKRKSLDHYPKRLDPFPMRVAINFIYQIASGMEYIHKRKLLHGDLKALNVLVKRHEVSGSSAQWKSRYELKISDFGVSDKLIMTNDHSGHQSDYPAFSTANAGTPRWRAPEVFDVRGRRDVIKPYTMKADVYSFAMTCVEILTRQVPFHGIDAVDDIRKLVKAGGRPELPSNVPEDLRKLIFRCWDQEPTSRPGFSEICTCMQKLKDPSSPGVILSRTRSRLWSSCYNGRTVAD